MSIYTLNINGESLFQKNYTGYLNFPDEKLSTLWLIEGRGELIRLKRKKYNIGGTVASAINSYLLSLTKDSLQALYDSTARGDELFNTLNCIANQTVTTFNESKGWKSMDSKGYLFSKLRSYGSKTVIGCNTSASIGIVIIKNTNYRGYTVSDIYINDVGDIFKELSPEILHLSIIKQFLKHKVSMKVELLKRNYENDPDLYSLNRTKY